MEPTVGNGNIATTFMIIYLRLCRLLSLYTLLNKPNKALREVQIRKKYFVKGFSMIFWSKKCSRKIECLAAKKSYFLLPGLQLQVGVAREVFHCSHVLVQHFVNNSIHEYKSYLLTQCHSSVTLSYARLPLQTGGWFWGMKTSACVSEVEQLWTPPLRVFDIHREHRCRMGLYSHLCL